MIEFTLNGKTVQSSSEPDTPLLWVLRDEFKLKGTKFGCGIAQCGACTVHINGSAKRSCITAVERVAGRSVVTIEGLSENGPHPVQQAWIELQVPQCGYCQSGQIMTAADLLAKNASPSREEIVEHMSGNLCRCMAYPRIERAVARGAELAREAKNNG
ncbi:MAG: (2Fe-2S)-binding protein [Gammaproteobacteria bacterium]